MGVDNMEVVNGDDQWSWCGKNTKGTLTLAERSPRDVEGSHSNADHKQHFEEPKSAEANKHTLITIGVPRCFS